MFVPDVSKPEAQTSGYLTLTDDRISGNGPSDRVCVSEGVWAESWAGLPCH